MNVPCAYQPSHGRAKTPAGRGQRISVSSGNSAVISSSSLLLTDYSDSKRRSSGRIEGEASANSIPLTCPLPPRGGEGSSLSSRVVGFLEQRSVWEYSAP